MNFKFENYENDFYYAFDKFELKDFNILKDYLYIDANDTKENVYLKLIFADCKYKKNEIIYLFVIIYKSKNCLNLLKD